MVKAKNGKKTVAKDFEATGKAGGGHELKFGGTTRKEVHQKPKKEKTGSKTIPKSLFAGGEQDAAPCQNKLVEPFPPIHMNIVAYFNDEKRI